MNIAELFCFTETRPVEISSLCEILTVNRTIVNMCWKWILFENGQLLKWIFALFCFLLFCLFAFGWVFCCCCCCCWVFFLGGGFGLLLFFFFWFLLCFVFWMKDTFDAYFIASDSFPTQASAMVLGEAHACSLLPPPLPLPSPPPRLFLDSIVTVLVLVCENLRWHLWTHINIMYVHLHTFAHTHIHTHARARARKVTTIHQHQNKTQIYIFLSSLFVWAACSSIHVIYFQE